MNEAPFDRKAAAEKFKLNQLASFDADPQVTTIVATADGKTLLAAGYDARIRRWKLEDNKATELAAVVGHNGWTQALALAPAGDIAFSGDSWGQLRAWPIAAETPQATWHVESAHEGWLRDIAVSPDGSILATCGADRKLKLWSADGKPVCELAGQHDDLYSLRFSPDGKFLMAGDRKGSLWQWDVAARSMTKKWDAAVLYKYDRLQVVGGVRTIAFDRNGKRMAVGGLKPNVGATIQGIPTLLIFDFATGETLATHELGGPNDCDVMGIAFHPEGFFVAICNGGPGAGKIVLQQPGDKEAFLTETKLANCQSMVLSPDGKQLLVSSTNRDSNGNGKVVNPDGTYKGNRSPITLFALG